MWVHQALGSSAPTILKKMKKGMMVIPQADWHLKKRAAGAVKGKSLQEKTNPREDETQHIPQKRNDSTPVGYSGQIATRREQCDMQIHY
jgi:hypothetical protein